MTFDLSIVIPLYEPDVKYLEALLGSIESARAATSLSIETVLSISDAITVTPAVPTETRLAIDRSRGAGIGANWNLGVQNARSETVLVIGQDDLVIGPAELQTGVRTFEQRPELSALGSSRRLIDAQSMERAPTASERELYWARLIRRPGCVRLSHTEIAMNLAVFGNVIGEPGAVLFRRSAWERAGGFDESLLHTLDIDFWARLGEAADLAVCPSLCWYARRLHPQSATNLNLATGSAVTERVESLMSFAAQLRDGRARRFVLGGALMYGGVAALRCLANGQIRLAARVAKHLARRNALGGVLYVPLAASRRRSRPPWGTTVPWTE